MGFSKKNVPQLITVAFTVEQFDESTQQVLDRTEVKHIFKRPSIKEREMYRSTLSFFEKGQLKPKVTKANLWLWEKCISSVEGYDDLDETASKEKNALVSYFSDDLGSEHRDASIRLLMDRLNEEEVEITKN